MPDGSNPELMATFLTQLKLTIEELSTKGQSRQVEIRSIIPSTDDMEEGEFVAYINGATIRVYTKQNGTIRYWNLT